MDALKTARTRIYGRGLKIVMPEGHDARVREAAEELRKHKLAEPILLTPEIGPPTPEEIGSIQSRRQRLSLGMASRLLAKPSFRAGVMVATGSAHAMLAGATSSTARVIEAGLMTIGLAPGIETPSSFYLMQWPDRRFVFADCAVNIQPSASQLADIALSAAESARLLLDEEPRVAMLSFSTKGSGHHSDAQKVADALQIAKSRNPGLKIDGELQSDAAISQQIASRKLKELGAVAGRANVLVFPDLDAANISYKLLQHLGGAQAIGPILQGFARPISDISRGATAADIAATAILLLSTAIETDPR
jgi:phosphate acetyltransferase